MENFTCPNCNATNPVMEDEIDEAYTEDCHWLTMTYYTTCPCCGKGWTWDRTYSLVDKTAPVMEED